MFAIGGGFTRRAGLAQQIVSAAVDRFAQSASRVLQLPFRLAQLPDQFRVLVQLPLIALDRQRIVAALRQNLLRRFPLTVHGIRSDRRLPQIENRQQAPHRGNLVRLVGHRQLPEDESVVARPGVDHMHQRTLESRIETAAKGLAADGGRARGETDPHLQRDTQKPLEPPYYGHQLKYGKFLKTRSFVRSHLYNFAPFDPHLFVMPRETSKPWGGRFSQPTDTFVERFTASISYDKRLYHFDIIGSIAHANMLCSVGVLSANERDAIITALEQIESEIEADEFVWSDQLEDVHMNIEARLVELIGETGKKLHTARSRNDQVATDIRLWLIAEIELLRELMSSLMTVIVDKAEAHATTIMPGYTHLQSAQPITFGHHMLAWFEMLFRDRERLVDCLTRVQHCPLGAGALAGTRFPIDRMQTASELGFDNVASNSLDAVSDRDFALEFAAIASIAMVHFSRWCEELVLWSSPGFNFVSLPDSLCTGSSIMPQKKNPDVAELIRGKSGRVVGNLNALLVLMKGQPLAYNRDNQEDKEPLFDTADSLRDALIAIHMLIENLQPNVERMHEAAQQGYSTATDLADWLVMQGIPFRDAHEIVGKIVAYAETKSCQLHELDIEELRDFDERINTDVFDVLTVEGSVASRSHIGGTAPNAVLREAERARQKI